MRSIRLLSASLVILIAAPALAQPEEPAAEEEEPAAEPPAPEPEAPAPEATATDTAAAPAPAEPAQGRFFYQKGATFVSADDAFELKIVGRLQARWELYRPTADGSEFTDRFLIPRARVTLEGHAFENINYKWQTDFAKGNVYLRDFYLDRPLKGEMRLRVGQWKKPFSRQQITSSGSQQLVDRSVTDEFDGAGRDIGIAIHNNYEKSPEGLEWALGVYNGTGDKGHISCTSTVDPTTMTTSVSCSNPSNVPADIGPTVVAHVGFNHGGIKGYSESDLEGGPLRYAAAISYIGNLGDGSSDAMQHRVGADLLVKSNGASLAGGLYLVNQKVAGESNTDVGFFAQGGYFLTPKHIEVAARFSQIPEGSDNLMELLGGINWFAQGHALKWQTDAGILRVSSDPAETEIVVRTQAQLVF